MNKSQVLARLKSQNDYYNTVIKHFENKLKSETVSISNSKFIKILAKLDSIESKQKNIQRPIKYLKLQQRFDKRFIVGFKSRVKLVSVDFEITLWVDAKNTSELVGRRVGELIHMYNTTFKIAGVY